ncbi:MAG: hypothetical protein FJW94_02180 [Actinobacteria bacterium]|nr:hypothetical protein [Actinomycetota bacterium]
MPRRVTTSLVALAVLVIAAVAAACSNEESATTTQPSTPTVPPTTATTIVPGSEPAIEPDWAWQSGRPGGDTAAAATGRLDSVVLIGEGPVEPSPTQTGTVALSPVVATLGSADGAFRSSTTAPPDGSVDQPRGISSAVDGTTLTCGSLRPDLGPQFGTDIWCSPVAADGTLQPRVGNGSEGNDEVSGVAMVSDAAYAFVSATIDGLFPGAEDPTGGFLGERDALLIRTDPNGQPRWARQFGTQGDDSANAVSATGDGDAVVAGSASADPFAFEDSFLRRGGRDAWVARSDPSGNQRWLTPFGTSADDDARAIAAGGDPAQGTEAVIAAGVTNGDLQISTDGAEQLVAPGSTAAAGGTDGLIAAFDSAGRQQWITQFGSPADDDVRGVVVDGSVVYVAGTAGAPITGAQRVAVPGAPDGEAAGGRDAFLSAYDLTTGTWQWTALFGSPADDEVTGLAFTDDGHVVVVGTTAGTITATPLVGPSDAFAVAFPVAKGGGSGAASSV